MRSKYFQIASFLLLTTAVILSSCGGSSGGGGGAPAASLAMKGTSGNAVDMNGAWTSECFYSATDHENERDVLTMNGGSATVNLSIWSSPTTNLACTQAGTPDVSAVINVTATLSSDPTQTATWVNSSGAASTPPAGVSASAKATKVTLVFNAATVSFNSDTYVSQANSGTGFCGRTNWVKGVPQNALTCTDVVSSLTETDYWVVDDSAAQLKWYSGSSGVAWQVENFEPMTK